MSDHATGLLEKALNIPPIMILVTSVMGVPWQPIFYMLSSIWVGVQMFFYLRKRWKHRNEVEPETGPAPL